jgi:hypothetical protein
MAIPQVIHQELDGQLGALPLGSKIIAIAGPAVGGTVNLPGAYGKTTGVVAAYTRGPLVKRAGRWITTYSQPALLCKTGASTAAVNGTIDVTGITGLSVVTNGATLPDDAYELGFIIRTGGTVGVAGITYQTTRDGFHTLDPVTALGTATSIVVPNTGGASFSLSAATLVAGDVAKRVTTAPNFNAAEIGAALLALKQSTIKWDVCLIAGDIDGAIFDAIETAFASMPDRTWVGGTRIPLVGESEATYLAAMNTIFSAKTTKNGCLCFGAAKITDGLDFNQYRQSTAVHIGMQVASLSEELDPAWTSLGAAKGVDIRSAAGNPDEHDEFITPGADDARYSTLRTWEEEPGVFIANARLFSSAGSDFEFVQHRRVFGILRRVLQAYFQKRLSQPVEIDPKTGFILEEEALEIESGADAVCRAALLAKPKCSAGGLEGKKTRFVKVSREDNLLSTKTMTVAAGMVPLSYPKRIEITESFRNPALQLVSA